MCYCIYVLLSFRLLHSDRDKIPDVPAVYFVFPTEENIQRICRVSHNFLQLKVHFKDGSLPFYFWFLSTNIMCNFNSNKSIKFLWKFFFWQRTIWSIFLSRFFKPLSASVALIWKPVNWFAVKINWLVSIWGQHWHLMG